MPSNYRDDLIAGMYHLRPTPAPRFAASRASHSGRRGDTLSEAARKAFQTAVEDDDKMSSRELYLQMMTSGREQYWGAQTERPWARK